VYDCWKHLVFTSYPVLHDQPEEDDGWLSSWSQPSYFNGPFKAIQIFKARALNAVSIHIHFKDLLRSYTNLGYLVEIPPWERGRDRLLGVLHNIVYIRKHRRWKPLLKKIM
jgi:hypothetical protein